MVEFVLRNITSERLVYEYYPEGKRNRMSGLISVRLKENDVITIKFTDGTADATVLSVNQK